MFNDAFQLHGLGLTTASAWMKTANNKQEMTWKNNLLGYPKEFKVFVACPKAFNVFAVYAKAYNVLVAYPKAFKFLAAYPKAFHFFSTCPKHLRSPWIILKYLSFSRQ